MRPGHSRPNPSPRRPFPRRAFLAACSGLLGLSGCGYQVVGKSTNLPGTVRTIAIPAFSNSASTQKLAQKLTAAVHREFLTRTRFAITPDPAQADAILQGHVINFLPIPTVIDPSTGRQAGIQTVMQLSLQLTDRATGKPLYSRPNFEVRERYEVSTDPKAYFLESDPALERLAQDVARSVVSAVLSGF